MYYWSNMKEKSNILRYNIEFRLQKIYTDLNKVDKISMSQILKYIGIAGNWKDLPSKQLSSVNSKIDQFIRGIK
jgi:hypothetical protein